MPTSSVNLHVSSLSAAEDALAYASCALLPAFSLTCSPKVAFPANREDLHRQLEYTLAPYNASLELQTLMTRLFQQESGGFSSAQQRTFTAGTSMYTFVRKAQLDAAVQYHTSAKEANDLICMAAEIGTTLRSRLPRNPTLQQIFRAYQHWINSTFRYEVTGHPGDHSAYALMRSGHGVCQAIAALTVLVLPHLGLATQYVSGQGLGPEGFAGHAWNVVRVPAPAGNPALEDHLQWYHVDFTFGMNTFTPHTLTPRSTAGFEKTHIWNREHINQTTLQQQYLQAQRLRSAPIHLTDNSSIWQLGDVTVTSPRPVIINYEQQGGQWVDLYSILRFVGGGCEYLRHRNLLHIVLQNRRYLVENGRSYLNGPEGYLRGDILRQLPLNTTHSIPRYA